MSLYLSCMVVDMMMLVASTVQLYIICIVWIMHMLSF